MTTTEIEVTKEKRFRTQVPKEHRQSVDTRLRWLYNQKFGVTQRVYQHSPDLLDRTAATIILQALLGRGDLESIVLIYRRIEGGPLVDEEVVERASMRV